MNKVILLGRLTRDPDIRYTQGQQPMCVARYSLAVDRRRPNADGQREADFINCIAFGKSGEFAERYLHKGSKIAIVGRIQTGSYTGKDGQKVYTTDVVIEEQEFAESANNNQDNSNRQTNQNGSGYDGNQSNWQQSSVGEGFMDIPDGVEDSGLPWN